MNVGLGDFAHDPCRRGDRWPLGAVKAGCTVTVLLRVSDAARAHVREARLQLGVWTQLSEPRSEGDGALAESGTLQGGQSADVLTLPCDQGFCARIDTSGAPRVLFYRFAIVTDHGTLLCRPDADGQPMVLDVSGDDVALELDDRLEGGAPGFQLTVYDPAFQVPEWISQGVMYQIFPDRFARGTDGIRREGLEQRERRGWPTHVHDDWHEAPDWQEPYEPVDFFGGTLAGIQQHLQYLSSLGVKTVYLNPICEARSNHRYNTGDYESVDPLLGTWDDFEQLADAAQRCGIRIMLDTVLSHTGADSRYFNASGTYGQLGAAQSSQSPFASWYDFQHPNSTKAPYRCWWGDPTLPEVDERAPSWQRYMLGSDGVLGSWLDHGARGLRLDVADEVPDDVLQMIRTSIKLHDPQAVVLGEVWEDPTTKVSYGQRRTYALGRSLDSVMNYPLREALVDFALGRGGAQQLVALLKSQQSNYPAPLYNSLMNLLSSHDVERIRTVLCLGRRIDDLPRDEQAWLTSIIDDTADERAARMQRVLAMLQYALPGVPCLYYGDERGMQGGGDPFDRGTFPWEDDPTQRVGCGRDATGFYQALGQLRCSSQALTSGSAAFFAVGSDVTCVLRLSQQAGNSQGMLLVANRGEADVQVRVDLADPALGLTERDVQRIRQAGSEMPCVFDAQGYGAHVYAPAVCQHGVVNCWVPPLQALMFELQVQPAGASDHAAGDDAAAIGQDGADTADELRLQKPMQPGAGVICHITSVPNEDDDGNRLGPGTLGLPARRFVDQLARCGVRYWQILPLNPTDEFGSPYAGLTSFAGNTALLEGPAATGQGSDAADTASDGHDDASKPNILRDATDAVGMGAAHDDDAHYKAFLQHNSDWLLPYATFMAIKAQVSSEPWPQWPQRYRTWHPELANDPLLQPLVQQECRRQFEFECQWDSLRAYANSRGVQIVGDMPIYVSPDSADVWAHPQLFTLDSQGNVALQGGVPPDQFTSLGQLWGNPTYRWDELRQDGYSWWLRRLQRAFGWYDYTRLDHFLGFSAYYAIPAGATALEGQWLPGPGLELFQCAYGQLGPLPVIAEDLGLVTPDVHRLLRQTGFAGMDVVQFDDGDPLLQWRPQPGKLCYASTHDTQTLVGWALQRYCGSVPACGDDADGAAPAGQTVRMDTARKIAQAVEDSLLTSSADVVMLSLQDVLQLGDEARMNVPGTTAGNWQWQACGADVEASLPRLEQLVQRWTTHHAQ